MFFSFFFIWNHFLFYFIHSEDEEQPEQTEGTEEQSPPPPAVKRSAWARPGAKKTKGGANAKNKHKGGKVKQPVAAKLSTDTTKVATTATVAQQEKPVSSTKDESDDSDAVAESDNETEKNDVGSDRSSDDDKKVSSVEDDDEEWEKFQQKLNKREKLEGKSKLSHSVHCPNYPEDKQEYWWTYICDRKSRTLLTAPYHVTNLVEREEIQLKFTAPRWPGVYTFAVCLRSGKFNHKSARFIFIKMYFTHT